MPHNITNQKALTNFESIVEKTWNRLVLSISKKIKNYNLSKTSYDIASEAISYALKNKNIDWNNFATAEKHLYYSAKKNSSWFIKKEVNNVQSSKVKYNLDSYNENKEGELSSENLIISHYSYEEYSKNLEDDEFLSTGHLALKKLDTFLAKKSVSKRDIDIYKSWELYSVPTAIVTKKYKISTSNLHKIVCTVNKIISRYGKELLDAA